MGQTAMIPLLKGKEDLAYWVQCVMVTMQQHRLDNFIRLFAAAHYYAVKDEAIADRDEALAYKMLCDSLILVREQLELAGWNFAKRSNPAELFEFVQYAFAEPVAEGERVKVIADRKTWQMFNLNGKMKALSIRGKQVNN